MTAQGILAPMNDFVGIYSLSAEKSIIGPVPEPKGQIHNAGHCPFKGIDPDFHSSLRRFNDNPVALFKTIF